jgi:succinate dehydrogenase/fumarate reductase flavoprotein subunit
MGCNASAIWRAHKRGAFFANPSWTQIHPTSLPQSGEYQSKLTLMSESLRACGGEKIRQIRRFAESDEELARFYRESA